MDVNEPNFIIFASVSIKLNQYLILIDYYEKFYTVCLTYCCKF